MRAHHLDVFVCSLLNAQPMGFYSVATIVEDARRHDLEVRPVCVNASDWHCTLETETDRRPAALRMGLRYVKGLSESRDWSRIEQARRDGRFRSIADFTRRTRLDERLLGRLAQAGAFAALSDSRRDALWEASGAARRSGDSLPLEVAERSPDFEDLSSFETIAWDYRTTAHSPRGHPLEPLRAELGAQGLPDARTATALGDGHEVDYAGVVITRQRPGTASGVTFMTLEDETGFVNVVLWRAVFERFTQIAKTASLLGVSGRLQKQDGVVHLVAELGLRRSTASA